MKPIDPIRETALSTGYTEAGWQYLLHTEMALRAGEEPMYREMRLLREKASSAYWARYCNAKAAGVEPDMDGLTIDDLST